MVAVIVHPKASITSMPCAFFLLVMLDTIRNNTEYPQTHYQGIVFVRGVKRVYVVNTVDTIRVPPAWKLRSIISLYMFLFQSVGVGGWINIHGRVKQLP